VGLTHICVEKARVEARRIYRSIETNATRAKGSAATPKRETESETKRVVNQSRDDVLPFVRHHERKGRDESRRARRARVASALKSAWNETFLVTEVQVED
jgi:vacuolar-type H+-ATPase subunit H